MDTRRFEELSTPTQHLHPAGRPLDVVFLGANLSNLASALTLASQFEGLKLRVYEEKDEFLGHDFIIALSKKSWDALSAICSSPEQALIQSNLIKDTQANLKDDTMYTTYHQLVGLFKSNLPLNSLVIEPFPKSIHETPEGLDLKMQDGSEVRTKLLVGDYYSLKDEKGPNNFKEINFRISGDQPCLDGCKLEGASAYASCHKIDEATRVVGGVFKNNKNEQLIDFLRQFPSLYQLVLGSTLEQISSRELSSYPRLFCGHGRSTFLSCPFRESPCILPQMCEVIFGNASLFKECISEKGLTPAALREFERVRQSGIQQKDMALRNEDILVRWGLKKSVPEPRSFIAHSTSKKNLSLDLSKGLVSLTPREGMGWRILT